MTGALDHVQSSVIMQTSPPDKTFQQLLFTGIFCWVLTIFLLLVVAWFLPDRESFSSALMWGLGHSWWAYGMGGMALLIRSALMRKSPLAAIAAYVLPAAAVSAASALCLAVYPDQSFREEMAAYSPALLVFYVFGFAWMRLRAATGYEFARAVLPPFVGGLILLAFVAVPVFTGNAFRYRDAFAMAVISKTQRDGVTEVDAVLEVRKPGKYEFTVPMFPEFNFAMEPDAHPEAGRGEIFWGSEGKPVDGIQGRYSLKIRMKSPVYEAPPIPGMENPVALEIREAENPDAVVAVVFAPDKEIAPKDQ